MRFAILALMLSLVAPLALAQDASSLHDAFKRLDREGRAKITIAEGSYVVPHGIAIVTGRAARGSVASANAGTKMSFECDVAARHDVKGESFAVPAGTYDTRFGYSGVDIGDFLFDSDFRASVTFEFGRESEIDYIKCRFGKRLRGRHDLTLAQAHDLFRAFGLDVALE